MKSNWFLGWAFNHMNDTFQSSFLLLLRWPGNVLHSNSFIIWVWAWDWLLTDNSVLFKLRWIWRGIYRRRNKASLFKPIRFWSCVFPQCNLACPKCYTEKSRMWFSLQNKWPNFFNKSVACWEPMAYACNSSYSVGRDQEDHRSNQAQANSSGDPVSKILNTKQGWWSDSRCRPWIQAPVPKEVSGMKNGN
jgi:hypothetical protein